MEETRASSEPVTPATPGALLDGHLAAHQSTLGDHEGRIAALEQSGSDGDGDGAVSDLLGSSGPAHTVESVEALNTEGRGGWASGSKPVHLPPRNGADTHAAMMRGLRRQGQ